MCIFVSRNIFHIRLNIMFCTSGILRQQKRTFEQIYCKLYETKALALPFNNNVPQLVSHMCNLWSQTSEPTTVTHGYSSLWIIWFDLWYEYSTWLTILIVWLGQHGAIPLFPVMLYNVTFVILNTCQWYCRAILKKTIVYVALKKSCHWTFAIQRRCMKILSVSLLKYSVVTEWILKPYRMLHVFVRMRQGGVF